MGRLSEVVEDYMSKTTGLKRFCDRCLNTKRYDGNVVLMVVDAAFDSIGLNYFNSIVPKVLEFEEKFVKEGNVQNLNEFSNLSIEQVKEIWTNKRSWNVAFSVASYLHELGEGRGLNDSQALRTWARNADLENWREDPIGKIHGVGLTTYQYLRMMGGVDTAMPDKIVRGVIEELLEKAGEEMTTEDDIELVKTIEKIAFLTEYKTIELCWMTWLVQSEGDKVRMEKYGDVLDRI
ncbi:hypothetical protein AKJ37_02215 [candidate division MSBL1 archaeon SCGC-AAA259I09]|uniref:Uncharacterized protein n=2 Tax=candidate division MSBL1 TaxID=215777 RepID=A0A133UUH5_9EURY|nr:hypothetical protein AKJ61_04525 [candidate division MSBL1 archaeon SCGC-AAA259B11]KXA97861.1 hypothetical protein AKJ37_02215 [candidate division MSBL1 archaeon SCGC-AAA259I09]